MRGPAPCSGRRPGRIGEPRRCLLLGRSPRPDRRATALPPPRTSSRPQAQPERRDPLAPSTDICRTCLSQRPPGRRVSAEPGSESREPRAESREPRAESRERMRHAPERHRKHAWLAESGPLGPPSQFRPISRAIFAKSVSKFASGKRPLKNQLIKSFQPHNLKRPHGATKISRNFENRFSTPFRRLSPFAKPLVPAPRSSASRRPRVPMDPGSRDARPGHPVSGARPRIPSAVINPGRRRSRRSGGYWLPERRRNDRPTRCRSWP